MHLSKHTHPHKFIHVAHIYTTNIPHVVHEALRLGIIFFMNVHII